MEFSLIDVLIFLLVIGMIFIIGFNIIAQINYDKSFELDIINTGVKCTYNKLPLAQTCPGNKSNLCYKESSGIPHTYVLGLVPVSFSQVCSKICTPDVGSKKCTNPILTSQFDNCINVLKPPENCTDVCRPLATDINGNYLYPQGLFTG